MPKLNIHLANDSVRSYDASGRLHVSRSHISKATVNPYYGREIPGSERLGLDPDKIYRMLRDPYELAKGAHTFERNQILRKHLAVNADDPKKDHIVGTIGSNVEFNAPYLDADLCFWDAEAIALIEADEVRELSCSYAYVPVMTPGTWEGQEYDGIMTEIVGNHLAQVEAGRAGSDVLVADEDSIIMGMTKLGKALFLALGGMSPKLAQDSALSGLVGKVSAKTSKVSELTPQIVAMDSALDAEKVRKVVASVFALDEEPKEKPKAEDEDEDDEDAEDEEVETEEEKKAREKKEAAKDKKAKDKAAKDKAAKDEADKDEKEKDRAEDRAIIARELREANDAKLAVRPVVGDVIAQDSAEEIYGFALDQMGVDRKGVTGPVALRALFTAANKPAASSTPLAMDAAGATTLFPGLSRFGR